MKPVAMPAGVSELFAYRLGEACGVRVPPVTLTHDQHTDDDCANTFVKAVPGGWAMSKRVPRSIPLYYLKGRCQTLPQEVFDAANKVGAAGEAVLHRSFVELLDKRFPVEREAYNDFPDSPGSRVLAAAERNSPQRILTYAFRALWYFTRPHNSNVMLDSDARL